nr:putative deoxyribonuclease RhsA [Paraburkholderia busanensis]
MKRPEINRGITCVASRLLATFALLALAFSVNADDCFSLYTRSGATPGSKTCRLDVTSNTPGGMGNYACINDLALIDQWCSAPTDPDESCPIADPVYPANGRVTLTESDFRSGDGVPLTFTRSYLSSPHLTSTKSMGPVWLNNWQRQLNVSNSSGSSPKVIAYRGNGIPLTFQSTNGQWRTAAFSGLALVKSETGWTLTDLTTDTVESYSAQGTLLSETTHTGFKRDLNYDATGRLISIVQHAAGGRPNYDLLTIKLEYDSEDRISRMFDPGGGLTQYRYDASSNLVSVIWPDGYVRRYIYDDVKFKNALTGIIDETGSRIATWSYDGMGRVTSVMHPDSAKNVQFAYGHGSTTVSGAEVSGSISFASITGMLRPTGGSTPDGVETRTLDIASGNLLVKTSPGEVATYSYDTSGRPVRAAVSGPTGSVITSVRYVDGVTLRPSLVATPGKIRGFVYDVNGNVTGYSEVDTTDTTGASGFEAISVGTKLTVGAVYDNNNRLKRATLIKNGVKSEDWVYLPDETGNIGISQDLVSGWILGAFDRDASNRVRRVTGNYREAQFAYDKRGRVSRFTYSEDAIASATGLKRVLTVDYGYTPEGHVASRTGTVANGEGAAQKIASDEIDQWVSNYEAGADLVGPPAKPSGLQSGLKTSIPATIVPVCPECYSFAKAKLAWKLFYRGFTVAKTGEPVRGEVPELQVVAQDQVPFPILMPDQNGQSKRAVLYAQLFSTNGDSDPGFVKCATTNRCRKVYQKCIDYCTETELPTRGGTGIPFFRCKNKCIADNGC